MVKVLVCCASGSGTSMMMKLTAEKACKSMGLDAKIDHATISQAKEIAGNYDLVITSPAFVSAFENVRTAAVRNPLSQEEYANAIINSGLLD